MPFRSLPFPLALLLSLLLHATIFAALVYAIRPSDLMGTGEAVSLSRSALAPDAPPDVETIQLGIADGASDSRTWIGYSTAEEHLAPRSEVEQAAFEDEPEGGAAGAVPTADAPFSSPGVAAAAQPEGAGATQPPQEISPPVTEEPPTGPPTDPPPATEPPTTTDSVPPDAPIPPDEPVPQPPPQEVAVDEPAPEPPQAPPTIEELTAMLEALLPSRRILDRWTPAPAPPTPGASPVEAPQRSAPPDPAAPPPPGTEGTDGASSPPMESAPGPPRERRADGDPSDRESDATSTVDVSPDQWRRGKPLAARGLDIRTKRPVFPELTSLTARPVNPVVEIYFDRRGVPRRVNLLRSSGDSRVDGPVIDAIYRWRASGSELARLEGEELFRLEMRILLGN